jgi:hemolysin activation/secretion protein
VILKPSFSQSIVSANNLTTTLRMDGQWSSEPLISNEQFGIGGVNSVRGYHEGEVFGDTGWHVTLEEDTPPHVVGIVYNGQPLTIRGSIYMDGAVAYLLDPLPGEQSSTRLWGTGFGISASVGSHWQAQFLFSVPLTSTGITKHDIPYFNFALTAQF